MESKQLKIHNSLTRQKEVFKPINPPFVGMYVCGPTVYSDVHIGNVRTFVSFDIIYRYLKYIGYKVRYVRNITDVGHLEGDADIGAEDKIAKKARLEQLEPMEITHRYTLGFHEMMNTFNTLSPSIEPRATGHIMEQIEMVQDILDNGFAYVKNGSVYFNTVKFAESNDVYGKLSGRKIEDLFSETRDDLKHQDEKNHPSDFAIWIKADENHLMRWNSPWSVGFPGWHLECSVMSTKYLGKTFDIHGGGSDLKFPHHENEVAQNHGACNAAPAKVWIHTNMLLMNGRKMSKSDGNHITPVELFTGDSTHITKAYSPMIVKFFMMQAHYGSTLDLSDAALLAAEKGYRKIMEANRTLQQLVYEGAEALNDEDTEIQALMNGIFVDMNDDFNTPQALAKAFGLVNKINSFKDGHIALNSISRRTFEKLQYIFTAFLFDICGLKDETLNSEESNGITDELMQLIIELRQNARGNKDWAMSDKIRDSLAGIGVQLKDGKEGTTWIKS